MKKLRYEKFDDQAYYVYLVFAKCWIENYYETDSFEDIFSTREKAQTYIDGIIHQRKLDAKREQLQYAFMEAWEKEHPIPHENVNAAKPKYRHDLAHNQEYNRGHEQAVREWREKVEQPYKARIEEHMRAKYAAAAAYMETVNMDEQDLSDVVLSKDGEDPQDNLSIRELEVK